MPQIPDRLRVNSPCFVGLPIAFLSCQPKLPLRQTSPSVCRLAHSPSRVKSTFRASLASTSRRDRVVVQGPCCRFVDRDILRHCVTCAKEVNRTFTEPETCVKKLLQEARRALKQTKRGKAERLFLRAIVVDPGRAQSYFLFALQVQRRDPQLARELFFLGVRENPHDSKILQAWGLFESKQGHLKRAQRLLRRSVFLEPKNAPVLRWKCLFPTLSGGS